MKNIRIDVFEKIKKTNQHQQEFWSARELAKALSYFEYRHFNPVIKKAQKSCKNAGQPIEKHFEDVLEMVKIVSNVSRQIEDVSLSRCACYLVMQNADPSKEIIEN